MACKRSWHTSMSTKISPKQHYNYSVLARRSSCLIKYHRLEIFEPKFFAYWFFALLHFCRWNFKMPFNILIDVHRISTLLIFVATCDQQKYFSSKIYAPMVASQFTQVWSHWPWHDWHRHWPVLFTLWAHCFLPFLFSLSFESLLPDHAADAVLATTFSLEVTMKAHG